MKKFITILIAAIGLLAINAEAQPLIKTTFQYPIVRNAAGTIITSRHDTMVNHDTTYLYFSKHYAYYCGFVFTNTKVSGTVVGTAVLQGTNDSVNGPWETITGVTSLCSTCVGASLTLTDATNTKTWMTGPETFICERIRVITTDSGTSTPSGKKYYNK